MRKHTRPRRRYLAVFAAISLLTIVFSTTALAANPGVDPSSVSGTVNPGGSLGPITKTVHTPVIPPNPDIVFLSDTTGSMSGAIGNVQANALNIMNTVLAAQPTAEFGVANYTDFNCTDPFPFHLDQSITANVSDAQTAINSWAAGDGCDTPEAQLNALYQLATDPAVGFRTGSSRIIVWFGDEPGHDPSNGITQADAISALQAAGIRVIAVDVFELDVTGQATAITAATGGVLESAGGDVSAAILAGLTNLPATVTHTESCDPGLTAALTPVSQTVPSGTDAVFSETISVDLSAPQGGVLHCTVSFAINGVPGGPDFDQSVDVGVPATTTVTYKGPSNEDFNDNVTLSAELGTVQGSIDVSGQTLTFTLGSQSCTGTTDTAGLASCTILINQVPGPSSVAVDFAGNGLLLPSSTTAPFTINQEEASITSTSALQLFAQGGPATLTSTLTDPEDNSPIGGKSVTMSLGSQSCSATTDAAGVATCTISPVTVALGPQTVTDTFAGDAYYVPASNTQSALVFAFLVNGSGGGAGFVIGDNNAAVGTNVTFWGAQWWKLNSLSASPTVAAFKGFANRTNPVAQPTCGGTWFSDPGNSSNPPAGPLPSYMAVIVTSNMAKAGSTISGDIAHIVIVQTGTGYAPNPGHAGTGTVVATLC